LRPRVACCQSSSKARDCSSSPARALMAAPSHNSR
jgi:hypothetical protein